MKTFTTNEIAKLRKIQEQKAWIDSMYINSLSQRVKEDTLKREPWLDDKTAYENSHWIVQGFLKGSRTAIYNYDQASIPIYEENTQTEDVAHNQKAMPKADAASSINKKQFNNLEEVLRDLGWEGNCDGAGWRAFLNSYGLRYIDIGKHWKPVKSASFVSGWTSCRIFQNTYCSPEQWTFLHDVLVDTIKERRIELETNPLAKTLASFNWQGSCDGKGLKKFLNSIHFNSKTSVTDFAFKVFPEYKNKETAGAILSCVFRNKRNMSALECQRLAKEIELSLKRDNQNDMKKTFIFGKPAAF